VTEEKAQETQRVDEALRTIEARDIARDLAMLYPVSVTTVCTDKLSLCYALYPKKPLPHPFTLNFAPLVRLWQSNSRGLWPTRTVFLENFSSVKLGQESLSVRVQSKEGPGSRGTLLRESSYLLYFQPQEPNESGRSIFDRLLQDEDDQ
jgi:hypothetical protein